MKINPKKRHEETPRPETEATMLRLLLGQSEAVYRFCLRLCGGRVADAEDLTQDAMVLAWRNRAAFAGRSALTTWLLRIALNRHFRLREREAKAGPPLALDEERDGGSPAIPCPTRQTLDRLELEEALETLPPHLRAAFTLVKVEGLKYREAAAVLGIPQGTVQYHVHDATLRLRAFLSESQPTTTLPAPERSPESTSKEAISHVL